MHMMRDEFGLRETSDLGPIGFHSSSGLSYLWCPTYVFLDPRFLGR